MTTALLIPCIIDQPLEVRQIAGFRDIQRLADMVIPVDIASQQVTMWLDAHDRYNGLPLNLRASSLRWYWDPGARHLPALHGDVLLVGDVGSTLAVGDVPEELLDALQRPGPHHVELRLTAGSPWERHPDEHETYADAAFWAVRRQERNGDNRIARIAPPA